VTGERQSQAGWLGPSKAGSQGSGMEAEFTSSSDTFARVSNANKELGGKERLETAPSRIK